MIRSLPQSRYATVFRLIVQRLQTDPVLSGAVKEWQSWTSSDPYGRGDTMLGLLPAVRLTPQLTQWQWYTPDSHLVNLSIKVEVRLEGIDADDCLNLWEAFERATYPASRTDELAWEQALRDAGCETGQIRFDQPVSIQAADENQFLCIGTISVPIQRVLTP